MKKLLIFIFAVALTAAALFFHDEVALGVSQGLGLCADVLIPSLFPFAAVSSLCLRLDALSLVGRGLGKLLRRAFSLPESAIYCVVFGFISGYPVGMSLAAELCRRGAVSPAQAKRLCAFCVNAGPAFTVTAVGSMYLGSVRAGIALLLSVSLSSVLCGIFFSRLIRGEETQTVLRAASESFGDAVVGAVASASEGIFSVCAYVSAFSALFAVLRAVLPSAVCDVLNIILEVTTGARVAARLGSLPLTAACIAFGGVCVMLQNLPQMKKCGVKVFEYLGFRTVNALTSYIICGALCRFFDFETAAGGFEPKMNYAPASFALLLACSLLLQRVGGALSLRERHSAV